MGSAAATASSRAREQITRICTDGPDARALRLEVLAVIRRVVGFDAYAWLITDPQTSVGSSPLADVPCLPVLPQLIRLKYLTVLNRWTGLNRGAVSLSRAADGDLSRSLMWREMLHAYQVIDIASAAYRDRFGCWGFLDLWRTQPAAPFTDADLQFLTGIGGTVTAALRHSQAKTFGPAATVARPPAGPVVLLLSPDLQVRAQTPQTQLYLRALVPPDAEDQAPVPASAYNVAAQLLATEAGADTNPPLARVHLAHGRWLTLRAARLGTAQPSAKRDIAVSIEPATPHDRVVVFARACGLSQREAELLHHLVTGAVTREIARHMFVSENTIQDHLKSIFAKTATRSRPTLLARALGTDTA
jgi:DNA-binding CsgD family transcriptional regulator